MSRDDNQRHPARRKTMLTAGLTTALGCALLLGGPGTLAGWTTTTSFGVEQIRSGSFSQEITAELWTLNGEPIPEEQLGAVRLAPGDVIAYAATSTPTISPRMHAHMQFNGIEALEELISVEQGVTMSWNVKGAAVALALNGDDSGTPVPVGFRLEIDASAGNSAMGGEVDLSRVRIALIQAAAPPAVAPEPEPELPDGAWTVSDPVIAAAIRANLKFSAGTPLLNKHKAMVTELHLNGTGVTDLTPLVGLSSITLLNLQSSAVTDLRPLAGLTTLKTINLTSTSVADLTPLKGLTNLNTLYGTLPLVTDWNPVNHVDNAFGRPWGWNRNP